MEKLDRIPNRDLLDAGLKSMEREGKPLEKLPTKGRAMIYKTETGKTVRARTCNDHVLVVLADSAKDDAKLNIEGTDFLLIVMPEVPRTLGNIEAYLVPTKVAVKAVRQTHKDWLASNPNTKGDNRTWNIWFDDDGVAKANGFARHWAEYKLESNIHIDNVSGTPVDQTSATRPKKLGDVIAEAQQQIAEAAGVPVEAIKITVDLST